MTEQKHLIWSNYGLDYEDWRADLEAEDRFSISHQRQAAMLER